MMKKQICLLLLLLLPLPVQAGSAWAQNMLARLDYLYVDDAHRTSHVWDGRIKALNGDAHDMRAHYVSQRPQLNAKLGLHVLETESLRLTLPVHFDNGFDAALYQAKPYMGGGLVVHWAKSERLTLGFHLHDALRLGGDVREQPCHDGLRRAFHCGTGLPWSDAAPHLRKSNVATFARFTLDWRF